MVISSHLENVPPKDVFDIAMSKYDDLVELKKEIERRRKTLKGRELFVFDE